MKGKTTLALLAVSILAVAACGGGGGGGDDASADQVAEGQKLFRTVCATCHGQNGEGMPALGKSLQGSAFVADMSDADLVQFLIEGRPATHPDNTRGVDMPPKGGNPSFTDEQLQLIVVYMRSL
jgi:mono/diheme cytochrome c family protein